MWSIELCVGTNQCMTYIGMFFPLIQLLNQIQNYNKEQWRIEH